MSLVVETPYPNGVPQTAVSGFSPTGAAWHWTAGGTGRAGWDGTVAHLIATRYTINASYHGGFWHEHATEQTIIQWIVPTTKAAHSVHPPSCWQYNANKDRATQEARFTEVRRILGAKAADPNAGMIAIAYAGMPADLERDLACPVFRADIQNLARQLVARADIVDRPHFGHGWIQPISRYEMDITSDFIGLLYEATTTAPEVVEEMQFWKPVREQWDVVAGSRFWDGDGVEKTFTSPERLQSIAESSDGKWRLCEYGNTEYLVLDRWGPRLAARPKAVPGTRQPTIGFEIVRPAPQVIEKVVVDTAGKDAIKAKVAALAADIADD